ncbi:hypothetical protein [Curtobacterium sp. MCBA15_013]|uniref:hypothetical protein n=1 Tax=Curtobacterium sp. MCBA15_013 TaxID=1898739 RepID=UPI0008DCFD9F|nr:hypothetical protein [Curtobacterium sp. MCBA15_013]OII23123.1 hypothetical protein BIV01_16305 [Curtobacterium sp. MCBA15_013]
MDNGWRDGLLVVWIISLLAAIGLWVSAIVIFGKGTDSVELVPLAASLAGAAAVVSFWWFVSLLLWLAVSAVVREHEKDRQQAARLR